MIDPNEHLSPRFLAIAAIVCFAPIVVSFIVSPGAWWVPVPGILFHLALFMLVPKLDAPDWAKAAGYVWLALDVTAGVMTMNGQPHAVYDQVRLGGHIFAGLWIVTVSVQGSLGVRITGGISGALMFLFTFASPYMPITVLGPAAILVLVWLGFIAAQNGTSSPGKRHARLATTQTAAG